MSPSSGTTPAVSAQVEPLHVIYQLTEAVTLAPGVEQIYEAALQSLERALDTDRASILLYDPDGVMRFKAWHGLSDSYRASVEGHSPWTPDAVDPEPLLVPDVEDDAALAAYGPLFRAERIRSLAFIPLISRKRLIGKFMVYFDRPRAFESGEVRLARSIAGHVAFAVDRRRKEEELALYRAIFAHSTDAIAIIDARGQYREQNAAHRALTGYTDQELEGKTPAIHLGEERFAEIAGALRDSGNYRDDVRSRTKAGDVREIDLSAFTVRDDAGEPVCYVGIKRDVTEKKRAADALTFLAQASAAIDRSLDYDATIRELASLPVPRMADWVLVEATDAAGASRLAACRHADPDGEERLRRLLDLSGISAGRGGGMRSAPDRPLGPAPLLEILGSELAAHPEAADLLDAVGARSAMAVPLRARGRMLGVLTLVTHSRDYDERDLAVAEDLARRAATALDNARLYREAQDSDRRKEEFLAVLAHELRNPMMPLLTCLELLRSEASGSEATARRLEIMERQVRNLTRLVDDLLDVSRVTRGKIDLQKRPVDMANVVARAIETARPLIDRQGLSLAVTLEPSLRLEADPLRLEQVLANLLHNAAKYARPRGRVEVSARRDGGWVVLRVRDDGQGIGPDMLPRVFDLFVQGERGAGGLGIGLTLVRTLVELHGGSVRAASRGAGHGSEFTVRLPVGALSAPGAGPAPAPPERRAGPPRRALVVDDNVDAAMMLAEALRARGHEVRVAHDGRSALRVAARFVPEIVLLDLALPEMDGYEVARRLREEGVLPDAMLVAVTGYGQRHHHDRTAAAGFARHLVKPVDLAQVDAVIASMDRAEEPAPSP